MRPRATSRERIDRLTLELFLARGYADVTTDEVVRDCGISRPTFVRPSSATPGIAILTA